MNADIDRCAWLELVYNFIEFYKWEPQQLFRGRPLKVLQDAIRKREVPLTFWFHLLLRW